MVSKSFVHVTSAGWHVCNLFSVQTSLEQVALSNYTSVGVGDFKTFPLLSAIGLHNLTTIMASRSKVGSCVHQKMVSYFTFTLLLWLRVFLHTINVQLGTPDFTSILKEVVVRILLPIKIH